MCLTEYHFGELSKTPLFLILTLYALQILVILYSNLIWPEDSQVLPEGAAPPEEQVADLHISRKTDFFLPRGKDLGVLSEQVKHRIHQTAIHFQVYRCSGSGKHPE